MTSRRKGADFERLVSRELYRMTGIQTSRNLEQVRANDQGDLVGMPGWTIECKYRRAAGLPEEQWWQQVCKAAARENSSPLLIFRTGRSKLMAKARVRLSGGEGTGKPRQFPVILTLEDWVSAVGLDRPDTGQRG